MGLHSNDRWLQWNVFFEKYGGDMNFEFSDDQLVMKEEVRKLFEKEDSVKRNRNILEGEENFD